MIKPSSGRITNKGIEVSKSEDWKPFTSSFIDESFLIGYLTPEEYFYFIDKMKSNVQPLNVGVSIEITGEMEVDGLIKAIKTLLFGSLVKQQPKPIKPLPATINGFN